MEIQDLAPQSVFSHFANICAIPHPSGHERNIAKYLISFAQKHKLEFELEECGNIIIKKKATSDRLDSPTVIMQAHMDMVPVSKDGFPHDFTRDPIVPLIKDEQSPDVNEDILKVCDGAYITASTTTLGADDGIGMALILAILEDDNLSHGPLTALFTVEEESSMKGAIELDKSYLEGDYLINLDGEDHGMLYVGCAGSINANVTFVPELVKVVDCVPLTLTLTGLKGGHSGADIHLGRGNAIDIMCGILGEISFNNDFFIQKFHGGEIRNSIPTSAYVELAIPVNTLNDFKANATAAMVRYQDLYNETDPDMHLILGTCQLQEAALSYTSSQNLISLLRALPNGVLRNSNEYTGIVETSCNLSTVRTKSDAILISLLPRSLKDHGLDDVIDRIDSICSLLDNVEVGFNSRGFGWTSPCQNQLIDLLVEEYQKQCQITPQVTSVHAGLECGYFARNNNEIQMVSFGPTILNPHSPDESLSIKHTQIVYEILRNTLTKLK